MMLNSTYNPSNEQYGTTINGTSSMYSVLQAPVLASKGHFYQFASGMENVTATMLDRQHN
jgi:hypothetical protein